MFDYVKKTIQISGLSAVLLGTAIFTSAPARAADLSQMFGADLTWQCGLSPTIQPRMRLNQNEGSQQDAVRFNILPCEQPKPEPPQPAPEPPLTQLIQQGVQMIQIAQPLLQQFMQPLTAITAPPAAPAAPVSPSK